jgi:hypothetical protein
MPKSKRRKDGDVLLVAGPGGATHQTAKSGEGSLTTNQGVVVADKQVSGDFIPAIVARRVGRFSSLGLGAWRVEGSRPTCCRG